MKRTVIYIAILIFACEAAAFYYFGAHHLRLLNRQIAGTFPAIKNLPADSNSARKTLKKARADLARFKPSGKYIVINTHANILTLRTSKSILLKAVCSTGSGGELVDSLTGRHWIFNTPRGAFKVQSKLEQPWWRKPDWAFIEENEQIPQRESDRFDPEMLGDFALGFGDEYYIHGTIYQRLLGVSVTHGCVRLGSDDLKRLYDIADIGTPIYIF